MTYSAVALFMQQLMDTFNCTQIKLFSDIVTDNVVELWSVGLNQTSVIELFGTGYY